MSPQLHRLLSIQGGLLDKYLEQNLGERYAYLILVAPGRGDFHVGAISNLHDAGLVEPIARQFAERLSGSRVTEVIAIGAAQTMEADHG